MRRPVCVVVFSVVRTLFSSVQLSFLALAMWGIRLGEGQDRKAFYAIASEQRSSSICAARLDLASVEVWVGAQKTCRQTFETRFVDSESTSLPETRTSTVKSGEKVGRPGLKAPAAYSRSFIAEHLQTVCRDGGSTIVNRKTRVDQQPVRCQLNPAVGFPRCISPLLPCEASQPSISCETEFLGVGDRAEGWCQFGCVE